MAIGDNLYQPTGPSCEQGSVNIHATNRTTSAIPDENYVAVGMENGYVVQRSDVVTTQIQYAEDASTTWRGILFEDQTRCANGVYTRAKPLSFVTDGQVRARAGEALAADILVCSDATGRLRAWVLGVDDALAVIGRTKSSCTAVDDYVEIVLEGGG